MKKNEFRYRKDWLGPTLVGTMILAALILYLGISFAHHSHIFDGGPSADHYIAYAVMVGSIAISFKCWYDVFDNSTVLLIDRYGICIRKESFSWDKLAGYKMLIHENYDGEANDLQYCIFDFVDETPPKTLPLSKIDVRMDEITEAITQFSSDHNVIFRGYETKGKKWSPFNL